MIGTITYFQASRGFGFVTTTKGERFFFHISNFTKGEQPVLDGQVEFEVGPPIAVGKKPMAVSVRYKKRDEFDVLAGSTTPSEVSRG